MAFIPASNWEIREICSAYLIVRGAVIERDAVSFHQTATGKYHISKEAFCLICSFRFQESVPSVFAVSSAEDFAACGVNLLSRLGAVTHLCFGSEDGNLEGIQAAAKILSDESPDFSARLREGLKLGLSWPQARNRALLSMDICSCFKEDSLSRLLGSPNNLLGIEYCKAIFRCRSTIRPVTIQRKGQGYHDKTLESGQASASAIRKKPSCISAGKKKVPVSRRLCFLGASHFFIVPHSSPHSPALFPRKDSWA